MSKAKIVLLSVVGLFVLAMLGTYVYFATRPPAGELVVIAPGQPVRFSVDGGEPIEVSARSRQVLELPAGSHSIKVLEPAALEREVEVLDRKTVIVPVIEEQCFATLDATMSHYRLSEEEEAGASQQRAPRFVRSIRSSTPFELPYATYTSPDDFPEERESGDSVMLLRSAACADIEALGG